MERQIYIEPLQKGFSVDVKSANKTKRNSYYSNASPCCKAKLSQKKFCGDCGEEVGYGESQHKIIKLGKEQHIIEKQALEQIKDELDAKGKIEVHTVLDEMPDGAIDRFDSLLYAKPVEKRPAEYKELVTLLKNRVAVGTAVFRSNEYQVVLTAGDDGVLRIRQLVEESQRYEFDPQEIKAQYDSARLNDEVVQLEQQILDKKKQDAFDVTQFRDSRQEYEEEVIERFILDGTVPQKEQTQAVKQQDTDELERLKALAEQ